MNPLKSPLLTDLYQLTMLQAYFAHGMRETAVFEFFVRTLPPHRNFLLAAGLEQALEFLEQLRFDQDELAWLGQSGLFRKDFVEHLRGLRFTGDVYAMPEGTPFFPQEPILRVTAPIPQAQLIESRLINLVHFETTVASKAARSVLVAPGKLLVDFGLRRAHGAEAGLLAARASYLAGFSGTATVLAAPLFGIPLFGTMAHSFVQAHDDEAAAFVDFAKVFPGNTVFLIDTYDTESAARKIVALAPQLQQAGIAIKGVRLDSGDLAAHARNVRRILDDAGLTRTTIFASGNLDEYRVRELLAAGAPIDGFGIGSSLVTASDAPFLDAVYKLQEYAGKPRRKRSPGKATWPGRKRVYRHYRDEGLLDHDVVTLEGDVQPGNPLLQLVMKGGRRVNASPGIETLRTYAKAQLATLPQHLRELDGSAEPYRVEIAPALQELAAKLDRQSVAGQPLPANVMC
ncbi:MAG: nicotinate phosphoribosyltransferase, partial [Betaproteobacteria bacterium]|nr:nicotinate phosphoribosyltransferase [Betaproteobacteria bacterium]